MKSKSKKKSTYKVKDILVDKEKIKDILKDVPEHRRRFIIMKHARGLCCICEDIPSKMLIYDVGDSAQKAQKIERYCDECFEQEQKKKWR